MLAQAPWNRLGAFLWVHENVTYPSGNIVPIAFSESRSDGSVSSGGMQIRAHNYRGNSTYHGHVALGA